MTHTITTPQDVLDEVVAHYEREVVAAESGARAKRLGPLPSEHLTRLFTIEASYAFRQAAFWRSVKLESAE